MKSTTFVFFVGTSLLALAGCNKPSATKAETSQIATGSASETAAPALSYSPYLKGDHTPAPDDGMRPYYGDTHLHTSYSTDAGMVGATVGPEDAYRFARGEEVKSNSGLPVRLQRPLDFLVIADHAENLGLAPMIAESDPAFLKNPWGKQAHDLVKSGKGPDAFNMWAAALQASSRCWPSITACRRCQPDAWRSACSLTRPAC